MFLIFLVLGTTGDPKWQKEQQHTSNTRDCLEPMLVPPSKVPMSSTHPASGPNDLSCGTATCYGACQLKDMLHKNTDYSCLQYKDVQSMFEHIHDIVSEPTRTDIKHPDSILIPKWNTWLKPVASTPDHRSSSILLSFANRTHLAQESSGDLQVCIMYIYIYYIYQ